MDKLTLDTNILRNWAWCEGRSLESRYNNDETVRNKLKALFNTLIGFRNNGLVEFGITTQLYTDYETDGKLPKHIEDMIGPYVILATPSIFTFPVVFPIVFVEEGDIEQLLNDVFPDSKPHHKKYPRNQKDALQLYAHMIARRDFFITTDRGIVNSQSASILLKKWNIQVKSLDTYVSEKVSSMLMEK